MSLGAQCAHDVQHVPAARHGQHQHERDQQRVPGEGGTDAHPSRERIGRRWLPQCRLAGATPDRYFRVLPMRRRIASVSG
jgi:hypothetical protein